MDLDNILDDLPPLNWDNFEETSLLAANVIKQLGDNKPLLNALLDRVRHDPDLFDLCETHELDDKIVLYDNWQKGYRIRLRLANENQYIRAHNHRFSFITYILYGEYTQRLYHINPSPSTTTSVEDVTCIMKRTEPCHSIFTISDKAYHSTLTTPYTISLVICGPPVKDETFIINMETGKISAKKGKKFETKQQQLAVKMSPERFTFWMGMLQEFKVI